jgi:oligogalacturonide transport system permease protein
MKLTQMKRQALAGLGFVSIWIVGFLVFTLYPLAQTVWLSLQRVKVTNAGIKTTWVGLENYKGIFGMDVEFTGTLTKYLSEIVVYVPVIVVFALIIALLLNMKMRGVGFFRTVFFLPVIITSGPVIRELMNNGAASLPGIASIVNMDVVNSVYPPVVADVISMFVTSFITMLWNSGIQILVFIAALQKIDPDMYEAAGIDGASPWEVFWKLTLPILNPMIVLNILFTVVMQSVFALNPVIAKIQSDLFAPNRGFGYAAALSWIYFAVMLAVTGLAVLITMRRGRRKL